MAELGVEHHAARVNDVMLHYVIAGQGRSGRVATRMAADLVRMAQDYSRARRALHGDRAR
jgi:hypothetical protein